MFVTGTLGAPKTDPGLTTQINYGGLWVYDIRDAANPQLVTHLPRSALRERGRLDRRQPPADLR